MVYIIYYLLAGLAVSAYLEHSLRRMGDGVKMSERAVAIGLWPVILTVFIIYFFGEIFRK